MSRKSVTTMCTEKSLRAHPPVIKAFMGLPADVFWALSAQVKEQLREDEQQRVSSPEQKRAIGGGRVVDLPLVIRVALVLTYWRLHVPQAAVARMYGATQPDVSRELSVLKLVRHFQALADRWLQVIFESELALPRFLQRACAAAERLTAKAARKRRTTAQILRASLSHQHASVAFTAAVAA